MHASPIGVIVVKTIVQKTFLIYGNLNIKGKDQDPKRIERILKEMIVEV